MALFARFFATLYALLAFFMPQKNAEPAPAPAGFYPLTALVVETDEAADMVFVEDYAGNLWSFEGAEDWFVGDFASLLMNDMGTPLIFDDEIVSVRYAGHGFWD